MIAGRVTDERGQPVVGARVIAFEPHVYTEMDMLGGLEEHGSTTDDRGDYRIWDLEPGAYVVAVMPEHADPAGGVVRIRRSVVFYPAGRSLVRQEPVKLGWGQVREGVDLKTSKGPTRRWRSRSRLGTEERRAAIAAFEYAWTKRMRRSS
ncbi:MAG: carboxypeptidase-like regulatory domain-containing protein [Bryobacterales bacterium]